MITCRGARRSDPSGGVRPMESKEVHLQQGIPCRRKRWGKGQGRTAAAGTSTALLCATQSTMHLDGELVMHDTPYELNTHLNFMLKAWGRVLITGLESVGCVTRGVLANPRVSTVTVIEQSAETYLKLVEPYMPKGPRITIIKADALTWTKDTGQYFDYAWHDLWTNPDRNEPALQVWHGKLIRNMAHKATIQGAWGFPSYLRRRSMLL